MAWPYSAAASNLARQTFRPPARRLVTSGLNRGGRGGGLVPGRREPAARAMNAHTRGHRPESTRRGKEPDVTAPPSLQELRDANPNIRVTTIKKVKPVYGKDAMNSFQIPAGEIRRLATFGVAAFTGVELNAAATVHAVDQPLLAPGEVGLGIEIRLPAYHAIIRSDELHAIVSRTISPRMTWISLFTWP